MKVPPVAESARDHENTSSPCEAQSSHGQWEQEPLTPPTGPLHMLLCLRPIVYVLRTGERLPDLCWWTCGPPSGCSGGPSDQKAPWRNNESSKGRWRRPSRRLQRASRSGRSCGISTSDPMTWCVPDRPSLAVSAVHVENKAADMWQEYTPGRTRRSGTGSWRR